MTSIRRCQSSDCYYVCFHSGMGALTFIGLIVARLIWAFPTGHRILWLVPSGCGLKLVRVVWFISLCFGSTLSLAFAQLSSAGTSGRKLAPLFSKFGYRESASLASLMDCRVCQLRLSHFGAKLAFFVLAQPPRLLQTGHSRSDRTHRRTRSCRSWRAVSPGQGRWPLN